MALIVFLVNVFQKAFFFTKYLCVSSSTHIYQLNTFKQSIIHFKSHICGHFSFYSVIVEKMYKLFFLNNISTIIMYIFDNCLFLSAYLVFFSGIFCFSIIWRIILSRTKKCWNFKMGQNNFLSGIYRTVLD